MKVKILLLVLMILTNKLSQCQNNHWILSCGNPISFEFFAFTKKHPGILFYGKQNKINHTIEITVLKMQFVGDSLFHIAFPHCFKSELISKNDKLKSYSILDRIDINNVILIENKDDAIYKFLFTYYEFKYPQSKPQLLKHDRFGRFKKDLGEDFITAFDILIKEFKMLECIE